MNKIFSNTEISLKYILCIGFLFLGFFAVAFMAVAPRVWDDMIIFFFLPLIPLIMSLLFCWDFILEKKTVHRVFGVVFILVAILFFSFAYESLDKFFRMVF